MVRQRKQKQTIILLLGCQPPWIGTSILSQVYVAILSIYAVQADANGLVHMFA